MMMMINSDDDIDVDDNVHDDVHDNDNDWCVRVKEQSNSQPSSSLKNKQPLWMMKIVVKIKIRPRLIDTIILIKQQT